MLLRDIFSTVGPSLFLIDADASQRCDPAILVAGDGIIWRSYNAP